MSLFEQLNIYSLGSNCTVLMKNFTLLAIPQRKLIMHYRNTFIRENYTGKLGGKFARDYATRRQSNTDIFEFCKRNGEVNRTREPHQSSSCNQINNIIKQMLNRTVCVCVCFFFCV